MIYRMAVKYIQTVFFLPVLFSAVFFRLSLVSFMSTFSLFVFPPSSSASPLFCIHIHADRLSEQFPRLYFFTLKGCFGWWVRREAGHHLAGRRRVEISEYNLEDEFWTLVTDISCWEKKLHRPQTIWDDNPAGRERIWGGKHEHNAQKHLHHRINIRKVSVGQTTPSETYCLISGHSYDYQGVSNRAWKYININITL